MSLIGVISEPLLYLCFSVIVGTFILQLVPEYARPSFHVSKGALLIATGGIAFLSFVPVLQLILYLYQNIGFTQTFNSVLFTFEIGKAWLFTYVVSNLLFIYIVWFDYRKKPLYPVVGLMLTFVLVLSLGWSSHASSIKHWSGFMVHTLHFLSVTIWIGILLVSSWSAKTYSNWRIFLKWFTPVAVICFFTIVGSGLYLMTIVVQIEDYMNAWMLPYGHALFIKHLLLLPLLAFIFINSIFVRRKLNVEPGFNPIPWTKAESLVVFLIFVVTAVLGQSEPPHDIKTTLASSGVSKLFDWFYQGKITLDSVIMIKIGLQGWACAILSLSFLSFIILSYYKKAPIVVSFFMSILTVFSAYLTIMVSIQ